MMSNRGSSACKDARKGNALSMRALNTSARSSPRCSAPCPAAASVGAGGARRTGLENSRLFPPPSPPHLSDFPKASSQRLRNSRRGSTEEGRSCRDGRRVRSAASVVAHKYVTPRRRIILTPWPPAAIRAASRGRLLLPYPLAFILLDAQSIRAFL